MTLSQRSRRALTIGAIAFVIAGGVAWVAAAQFGVGSRSGGAIVGGSLVAVMSVAAAVGRGR